MGRGRAKAKQTKVARALKYSGPQTDFDRLQAELAGGSYPETSAATDDDDVEDADPYADDPYAKYYDESEDDDQRGERAG